MPRAFNQRQRLHAYAMTDGLCALCGEPLDPDSFHADHIMPWIAGGETSAANAQPLCPTCNLKKGGNMFLSHQQRFQQICRDMKTSTALRLVLAQVVCGGGKSIYPIIAAYELVPLLADGLCWVSPRDNLRSQGEGNFMDPRIRSILGHNLEIRAATNDADPMRDKVGYATTYQALAAALRLGNDNPHLKTFRSKRMILILDEPQHSALNGAFHAAIEPLKKLAVITIMFSGCLSRHDNQMVAYLDYLDRDSTGKRLVDLSDTIGRRIIRYGLGDATKEKQLIEIKFELRDADHAAWEIENEDGKVTENEIDTFDGATSGETRNGLFTALTTGFADDLLCEAGEFWLERRKVNSRSKFLVVCSSISQANRARTMLRSRLGIGAEVAHSDPDTATENAILRFRGKKRPEVDALVTVQMAYEGLDCPPADVLACLTHIRSREWIEQCIHRITRYDRDGLPWERQFATIFAPKDRFFREIMQEIEEEQAPYVHETLNPPPPPPPQQKNTFRPIESEMGAGSAYAFGGSPIDGDEHTNLYAAMRAADLYGELPIDKAKRFYEAMNNPAPTPEPEVKPPSEREDDWKRLIEKYKRSDYRQGDPTSSAQLHRRGSAIWRMYKKGVEELTEPQLEAVWNARHVWFNA